MKAVLEPSASLRSDKWLTMRLFSSDCSSSLLWIRRGKSSDSVLKSEKVWYLDPPISKLKSCSLGFVKSDPCDSIVAAVESSSDSKWEYKLRGKTASAISSKCRPTWVTNCFIVVPGAVSQKGHLRSLSAWVFVLSVESMMRVFSISVYPVWYTFTCFWKSSRSKYCVGQSTHDQICCLRCWLNSWSVQALRDEKISKARSQSGTVHT